MSITTRRIPLYALSAWLVFCCAASAEKVTVRGPRPVADAVLKLETQYGWPITYEDPPWVYKDDVEDVTSRVRKDGKSAGEGVQRIVYPRGGTFTLVMEDVARLGRGQRLPATVARAAILAMLKSYSQSIGGVEIFALSESDGLFHVVPVQRRDASGRMERIVPLLDTPVSITSTAPDDEGRIVDQICRSLAGSAGTRVDLFTVWQPARTDVVPTPGESARSVLNRLFAQQSMALSHQDLPTSWALLYEPSWGYMLHLHRVDPSNPR